MKITIIIFLSVIYSPIVFAQQISKSAVHSGTNHSTAKIRHTVGQPLAPTTQTSFLYGFQAPILIKVEIDEAVDVAIYPNPVNETLHINIPKLDYTFTIHSLSGKLLVSGLLNQKQNDISLQKLPKGIYALRVYNAFERVQTVAKIIKE